MNRDAAPEEMHCNLDKVNSGDIVDTLLEILKEVVEVTIVPDQFGATPLHYAAKAGMVELVELLLDRYPNAARETDAEGWLPLHYACTSPDVMTVEMLLAAFPEGVQGITHQGELPLHFACDAAHRRTSGTDTAEHAVAKIVLEAWPEGAYSRSSFGQRPLLYVFGHDMLPPGYAARLQEEDGTPDQVVQGAPVQVRALFQRQPLQPKQCGYWERWACVEGIKQMIAMFADDRDCQFKLPLHYACKHHEGILALAVVKALLRANPEAIREVDELGNLPIHYATMWREPYQASAVDHMLALYPQSASVPNRLGVLPVHLACRNGGASSVVAVEALLRAYPAGLTQPDRQGLRSIHHGCNNLGKGATVPIVDLIFGMLSSEELLIPDRDGLTPLHHACKNEGVNCGKIVNLFLDSDELRSRLVMAKDREQRLPIHFAAANQTTFAPGVCKAVLAAYSEGIEAVDRDGALPLHHAALNEGPAALNVMRVCLGQWSSLDHKGAELADRGGCTPLHHACRNESELGDDLVAALLDTYPAAAAHADRNGFLPMHHACANQCGMRFNADVATDTFEKLRVAFRGATYHEDRDGRLPLHHACMNKGPVANYLVHELANIDSDGANKHDRFNKLPLDYARANDGLAASKPLWFTLEVTQLIKYRDYVEGDEVGEFLGYDRDVYGNKSSNDDFHDGGNTAGWPQKN
eukprot:TRINITY_DN1026_c0_g1_i13.p1 TRINITY_DN1026_c0_g1~~TRINITY_DN1026_c0_g1_i13.p1  ORF type:complete len:696 (+),score=194.61 TRINITY_DN1026_c0_g1_i13:278-2365(+)